LTISTSGYSDVIPRIFSIQPGRDEEQETDNDDEEEDSNLGDEHMHDDVRQGTVF
jgi:hypothetical protein